MHAQRGGSALASAVLVRRRVNSVPGSILTGHRRTASILAFHVLSSQGQELRFSSLFYELQIQMLNCKMRDIDVLDSRHASQEVARRTPLQHHPACPTASPSKPPSHHHTHRHCIPIAANSSGCNHRVPPHTMVTPTPHSLRPP